MCTGVDTSVESSAIVRAEQSYILSRDQIATFYLGNIVSNLWAPEAYSYDLEHRLQSSLNHKALQRAPE